MPNWVRNKVKFGTDQVIKDCMTIRETGNKEFDFNKVIPMPKELEEENGFEKLTMEEKLIFLKENDNCDNWYDWNVKHWGTKWNSSETFVVNDKEVEFDTAWSTPEPIFKAISKKYNTTVKVGFADEAIGENCGILAYKNGEETYYKEGDADFAERIWGYKD